MNNLSPAEILAIPAGRPDLLFTNNLGAARQEFIELSKRFHPDRNGDGPVFAHVSALYAKAKEVIGTAAWNGHSRLILQPGGKTRRIVDYLRMRPFELGEMYVGHDEVAYAVKHEYDDLVKNAHRRMGKFAYASGRMEQEMAVCLPKRPELYRTKDRHILVVPKGRDFILLADLIAHYGGKIDPLHAAWIQSTVHNLACYLSYSGIMHGDISPDTYFVSPKKHSGALLGGWWYATKRGSTMAALPKRSMMNCPPLMLRTKRASRSLDLELVRLMGREILGDASGVTLRKSKDIPKALGNWFNGASSGDPVTDYSLWKDVLRVSFGAPKFVELHIDADTVYGVRKEER